MVQRLGDIVGKDINIENQKEFKNLPENSEFGLVHDSIPRPSIVELDTGTRLIVMGVSKILIPKPARAELVKILHNRQGAGYSGLEYRVN